MRPPDIEVLKLVAQWVRKADLDFDVVERLAADGERFRDSVAFHAQQAVEKYLKALLVLDQVEFPRTHDIEKLLHLLRQVRPSTAEELSGAEWLTPYGVDVRYPGDVPDTLPGDELRALEFARHARETVMAFLNQQPPGG